MVFVPLASLDDPALVTASISQHAGLRDVDDLRRLELLLVLDNLEHLLGAADDIGSLLMNAPGVTVLVTSRTRLHVSAEHEFELEPFSREEAVEFFLLRAGTVKRDCSRMTPSRRSAGAWTASRSRSNSLRRASSCSSRCASWSGSTGRSPS